MFRRPVRRVVQAGPVQTFGSQQGLVLENNQIKYKISRVVGNGAFGIVVLATDMNTEEVVAIKRVIQDKRFKNRELEMQEMLHHPNVLGLKSSFLSKLSGNSNLCLNVVMDYFPQNLHQLMRDNRRKLPIGYTRLFSYELARGLAYIHSFDMAHRDLKPENVMVNKDTGDLKICDFGSAKILNPSDTNISYICSRYYRAPELVFGATKYSTSVDIWSYGCIVAEMISGQPFFQGDSSADQLLKIMKVIGSPSSDAMKSINTDVPPPKLPRIDGIGIENVLKSFNPPSDAIDMLISTLNYAPDKRPSAALLMVHKFHKDLFAEGLLLPNGNPLPALTNYDDAEWERGDALGIGDEMQLFVDGEKKRVISQITIGEDKDIEDIPSDSD